MNKSFNLIDKPWIPVSLRGEVSLLQVFTDVSIKELSGTVLENLSIFKLLLAISQAAFTPKDDEEWKKTNLEDFGTRVVNYLSKHHDLFDLYSEKPFLQFPILKEKNDPKKIRPLRLLLPEVGSSNNPVLTDYNIQNVELDSVKARLLLQQMNFAFGGKKVDQKICLSQGHKKSAAGANGVSLGKNGFLHSYYFGNSLLETIFLNLMTQSDIAQVQVYESGIGTPPWECMPKGEIDDIAVVFFALNKIVQDVDLKILLENWEGSNELIIVLKGSLEYLVNFTKAQNLEKLCSVIEELKTL